MMQQAIEHGVEASHIAEQIAAGASGFRFRRSVHFAHKPLNALLTSRETVAVDHD